MRMMDAYQWEVFNWFTKKAKTLDQLKKLCKKHFDTENVDILTASNVILMFEKENKT